MSKEVYIWWLLAVKDADKNQVTYDWVCNFCWILRNNMYQKSTLSVFNSKTKAKRNYLKNMFDNFLDKTK